MNEQPNRIASLDGLRAISIGLVLVSHLIGTQYFFVPVRAGRFFELGELGVRVFFVISGFLITNLLLRELDTKGRIHLGKFYFRRTFRIFPPYYVFLAVLMLLEAVNWIALAPGDKLHTLTYTSNYHSDRSWYVGHTWSLSVEEQFYLLWPAALIALGKRRGLWASVSLIAICPLVRFAIWNFYPAWQDGIGSRFETVADSIAVGCVLAATRGWLKQQPLYNRLLASRLFILVPVAVLLANATHDHPQVYFLIGYTVMNVGIALAIDWCVTYSEGRIGRVLNSRPLVFVGVMSYSIYLWQQLFLNRYSTSVLTKFPLNILLVGLFALASYYLIESPSLRLRQRLESRLFKRGEPLAKPAGMKEQPSLIEPEPQGLSKAKATT
jgi:peptidoglycan/LPS O-acetylase OafA/YrhL